MNKKLVLLSVGLLAAGSMTAQTRVTGHVVDSNGDPVVGATVKIEGTKIFTRTDDKGNFILSQVPASAKRLVVSYIGLNSANVSIAGNVNVVLKENQLETAVVQGYGTARKLGTVVGSVTNVSADKIENKPVTTALDALQGKVAGVQILNNSGDVGNVQAVSTLVRGKGSLNGGNAPLFVIDGQPVGSDVFYMINPNDIASYSVLRDASATSIYGSRAANGVIFVTTKKGKAGEKAQIKVGQTIGWSMLAKRLGDPMDSNELLDLFFSNGVITGAEYQKYKLSGINTDWLKYFYRDNAPMYNTNFSLSGASDRTNYYLSASYMKKMALTPFSHFKRYTARINVDTRATDWFRMGVNLGLNYSDRSSDWTASNVSLSNGGLGSVSNYPYLTPYDKDGHVLPIIPGTGGRLTNVSVAKNNIENNTDARLTGSAFVELTPIQGLTLKSQLGVDLYDWRRTYKYLPSAFWEVEAGNLKAGLRSEGFQRNANFTITNTAEYKFNLQDEHHFTFLLGQEGLKNTTSAFKASSKGMSDDRLMNLQEGTDIKISNVNSSAAEVQYLSFFGRADYDYLGKYFLNFTLRNDRSSRFGANNRSATFASGGFMWNMKSENFLRNVSWLDDLRFRLSSGSTGNSQGIGYYDALGVVKSGLYNGEPTWYLSSPGNKDLGWETQVQTTVGLSARLFNRANIEVNYYNRATKDMLMDVPVPYTTGFSTQTLNVGTMVNNGFELQFDVDAVKNWNGLNVNVYGNFSYNKNKITKLFYGLKTWDLLNQNLSYRVGESVNFFMPVRAGVDPNTGKYLWYIPDANGEPTNKTTDQWDEKLLAANTHKALTPPINGGFGLSATWKGLTLNADFTYVLGKWVVNNIEFFTLNTSFTQSNQNRAMLDYWKRPGEIAKYAAFGEKNQFDTSLLENSSFMRLKNLSLSYDLPTQWMSATGFIRNVRFTAAARNLLTITKYKGTDPEFSTNIDVASDVPNSREYTLGVELTF